MEPIRLRGTADVLAALPYQLGYHPQDCLVVMALHERRVGLVERIDLPDPDHLGTTASSAVEPLMREGPDSVLLVGYESCADAAVPLLDEVGRRLRDAGIDIADRLVVRDGRWYARAADDGPCLPGPIEGTPLPDPSETPAIADFVAMGLAPLPERGSLATLVAADQGVCREVATALRRQAQPPGAAFGLAPPARDTTSAEADPLAVAVRRLSWLSLWGTVCDLGATSRPVDSLGPVEIAELVASLDDVAVRDGLIAWCCPGTMPLDALPEDLVDQMLSCLPPPVWHASPPDRESVLAGRRLLARFQWLARAVPDARAAAMLTLTANLAWWLGDGTQARVALDRALAHAPGYRLARLLDQMVGLGLRPRGRDPQGVAGAPA